MGITIHYRGKLKDKNSINNLVKELKEISETLQWEYQVLDEDWSKPSTAAIKHTDQGAEIVGHLALKGISISMHPECEPLSLFFDSDGYLASPISVVMVLDGTIKKKDSVNFVKTQFAPPDVHISIINLLRYLKKRYIPDLNVMDEGEYWESNDKEKLIRKILFLQNKMDQLEELISDIDIKPGIDYTAEQLADLLEEKLKRLTE